MSVHMTKMTIGEVMSLSTTHNSVNIDNGGHIIYVSHVEIHGESKSEVRMDVGPIVIEIHHLDWMYMRT